MDLEKLILKKLYENIFNYEDFYIPFEDFLSLNSSFNKNNSEYSFILEDLEKRRFIKILKIGMEEKSISIELDGLLYYENTNLRQKERWFNKLIRNFLKKIEKIEEGRIEREFFVEKLLEILNLEPNCENIVKFCWIAYAIQGKFIVNNSLVYISNKEYKKITFRNQPPHILTIEGKRFLSSLEAPLLIPKGAGLIPGSIRDDKEKSKIIEYLELYKQKIYDLAEINHIDYKNFKLFKPSNFLIVIDDSNIFLFKDQKNVNINNQLCYSWDYRGIHIENFLSYYKQQAKIGLNFEITNKVFLPSEIMKMDFKDASNKINEIASKDFNKEYEEIKKGDMVSRLKKEEIFYFFDKASEDDFTKLFFAPLAKSMNFENVKVKGHEIKILEFGQDVNLMKFKLPTGHYLYFVAQIKKGKISSSAQKLDQEISTILTEIRQAFDKNIFDEEVGFETKPNHVYLISSGTINEYAYEYLKDQIEVENRRLLIIDRDKLYDLYNEFGLREVEESTIIDFINKSKEKEIK